MANLIGADRSIAECRDSGYVVINATKLMDRKTKRLDKNRQVRLTISNPRNWENGKPFFPNERDGELYLVDTWVSWNDLWELAQAKRDEIASMADWENCPPETENPTPHDLIHLATDVYSYYGTSAFN